MAVLDTGGLEDIKGLRLQWIEGCGGLIFVYDISEELSFHDMQEQLNDAQTLLSNLRQRSPTAPEIPIALVGNKTDKVAARTVPLETGQRLADEHAAIFLETSARYDAKGVEDLFIRLLKKMRAARDVSSVKD